MEERPLGEVGEMRGSGSGRGGLARWAHFAYRRRWLIVGVWAVILVGLLLLSFEFGGSYAQGFKLPHSEAQTAQDLLKARFPARSGDSVDIIFEAPEGISTPRIRQKVTDLLSTIAGVPGVVSVDSPYDQPRFVSKDGTIARAGVQWQTRSTDTDKASIKRFLSVVDAANGDGLRVEAGGQIVQRVERTGFSSEFAGVIAAIFILMIAFGSLIAMGLPIGAAIFGLGTGFAIIGLATNIAPLPSFSPQFAAMIGLGVGIDYSLLVVTRFREGIHSGHSIEDSVVRAVTTAGRSVMFAGTVVAVAFLGLFSMGVPFVAALGAAGAIIVGVAVLVALTLLPALVSIAGKGVDRWRVPFLHSTEGVDPRSVWFRLSAAIQKRPVPYFLVAAIFLLALGTPVLSMDLGFTNAGNGPAAFHSRRAYDLQQKGFGPGFNGTLSVVLDLPPGASDKVQALIPVLAATDGVAEVLNPRLNPASDTATIAVVPTTSSQDAKTSALVQRIRGDVLPPALKGTAIRAYVGGQTAAAIDIRNRLSDRMPLLFGGVIGVSFLLLMVVFRSVLVALKAAIMNMLSIGASYGVLVAVFQWGWLSSLFGADKGPVETFLPMMMFAILFGLSMDYEVFLISRIREEYLRTGDNATAVSHGLAATARVITAAAAIMVAVFLTFVFGQDRVIKEFGLGLATAIFVDATVVRLILVPATMELLGDANWWLPRWLDRLIPHLGGDHFEAPGARESAPIPVAAID